MPHSTAFTSFTARHAAQLKHQKGRRHRAIKDRLASGDLTPIEVLLFPAPDTADMPVLAVIGASQGIGRIKTNAIRERLHLGANLLVGDLVDCEERRDSILQQLERVCPWLWKRWTSVESADLPAAGDG